MLENMPNCALLDGQFRKRLNEIIKEYSITTAVETGIDQGGSCMFFSEMVPKVIGIDNNPDAIRITSESLIAREIKNVTLIQGNSPDVLHYLLVINEHRFDIEHTIFLLDAHWQAYWPLRDEIKTIPKGKGILIMHDARVPSCPELGVDSYGGQELSYEYLKDVLTEWSPTHRIEYNDNSAEFPRRGIMYVFPL